MIGLSFIAQTFRMEYKTVAESIGVMPQTVQDWLKGRRRIPAVRLRKLADLFGLPERYFQKELTDSDKIDILISRIGRSVPAADRPVEPYSTDAFLIWQEDASEILVARVRRLLSAEQDGNPQVHFRLLSDLSGLLEDAAFRDTVLRALQIFLYICLKRRPGVFVPPEYAWCENLDSPSIHLMRLILTA